MGYFAVGLVAHFLKCDRRRNLYRTRKRFRRRPDWCAIGAGRKYKGGAWSRGKISTSTLCGNFRPGLTTRATAKPFRRHRRRNLSDHHHVETFPIPRHVSRQRFRRRAHEKGFGVAPGARRRNLFARVRRGNLCAARGPAGKGFDVGAVLRAVRDLPVFMQKVSTSKRFQRQKCFDVNVETFSK